MKSGWEIQDWTIRIKARTNTGTFPDDRSLLETIEVAVSELIKGNNEVTATMDNDLVRVSFPIGTINPR